MYQRVLDYGSGIAQLGLLVPDSATRQMSVMGLFGPNCSEWCVAEYAIMSRRGTTVPMYVTLPPATIVYIINLTGLSTVATSVDCAFRLASLKPQCPSLLNLVTFEAPSDELRQACSNVGMRVMSSAELEGFGRAKPKKPTPPGPHDVFTFTFTSGSTGQPKGALISHESQVANVYGFIRAFDDVPETRLTDGKTYHLSYLPLAHAMERSVHTLIIAKSGAIGFARGDPQLIMEDVAELRPTLFATVPRLLTRLHGKIMASVNQAGGVKAMLFHMALRAKLHNLHRYGQLEHPLWDRLVFSKLRQRLGFDRLRHIGTGSAPIAGHVLDWLRVVFGVPVTEGWGPE